ncbi:MAG: hypothetical protein WDA09_04640, partial [Bacteriovoracaceae bacterium]
MKLYLLVFLFVTTSLLANPQITVLPESSMPHEFIHQNQGCYENSECDPVMGHQLHRWTKLI